MKLLKSFIFLLSLLFVFYLVGINISTTKKYDSISLPLSQALPTPSKKPEITTAAGLQSFSFAVISDIHSDYAALIKTLDRIISDKMEFVIIAGDLTTVGDTKELVKVKNILDKSEVSYYAVPGNHDIWSVKGDTNPYVNIFGSEYQSFVKENVKFILIDNSNGKVGIDNLQDTWLEKQLFDCPIITCLVFAHMPLNNPYLLHVMGEDSPEVASQAAILVEQMVNFKVKELFAGHIHYLSTYKEDGLLTNTDGAIYTNNNASNPRFLEVTVYPSTGKIEKKEIWIN